MKKRTTYSNKLKQIYEQNGLKQIIQFNTRNTMNSNTLIDLVLTNDKDIKAECMNDKISDHETIKIDPKRKIIKTEDNKLIKNWKNYSKENLKRNIDFSINWKKWNNLSIHNKFAYLRTTN